ncbi:MAG: hypothetical protein HRF43_15850 [Phycisphaerae bacterium]|jgi:hypothetical protein
MRKATSRSVVVALAGMALSLPVAAMAKAPGNPGVLPPQSKPYGKTYGQWAGAWWQWALSVPVHDDEGNNQHPLWDDTGEDAARGQSGPVWFLAGMMDAFPDPGGDPNSFFGVAERDVTVPPGKALFFPIINVECSVLEGNGQNVQELSECTAYYIDHVQNLSCELDGRSIQNLEAYRHVSPGFTLVGIEDNLMDAAYGQEGFFPAGDTTLAVAEGFHLMLAPLSVGKHELRFSGAYVFTEEEDGFDYTFNLDITYHLTVGHEKKHKSQCGR